MAGSDYVDLSSEVAVDLTDYGMVAVDPTGGDEEGRESHANNRGWVDLTGSDDEEKGSSSAAPKRQRSPPAGATVIDIRGETVSPTFQGANPLGSPAAFYWLTGG